MAQFKAKLPVFAKISSETEESITYSEGCVVGHTISVDINPTYSTVSLYGDDEIIEEVSELQSVEVTLNTTHLPLAAHEDMFGETVDDTDGSESITSANSDEPNYGGFGFVGAEKVSGTTKYFYVWLHKVKFNPPSASYTTKGETVQFNTPSITGKGIAAATGDWKEVKYYSSAAGAVSALKTKAGITETPTEPAGGTTGGGTTEP